MGRVIRGAIALGAVSIALGLVQRSLWASAQGGLLSTLGFSSQSSSNTVQTYWNETGMSAANLEDLIQDDLCQSSEHYFLSCANALQSVASKLQLKLNLNGTLDQQQEVEAAGLSTEKAVLAPWKLAFNRHMGLKSFLKSWYEMKAKFIQPSEEAMFVAVGLNGFLSVFKDPHTYLVPIKYYNDVIAPMNSNSNSLGIIMVRGEDSYFVRKVLEQSPADLSGLKKGDVVLEVNHRSIGDLSLQRLSDLLKANEGDTTHLVVKRNHETKTFRVRRSSTAIPTLTWKFEAEKRLGIITLNKFARGSCDKTQEALIELGRKNTRAILFDLRDNGGGQIEEATCIASLFLGKDREIMRLHYRNPEKGIEALYGIHDQVYFGSLGVIINSGTASAAEILAGVLQEYRRAVLVGERTFGKGSFQEGEIWSHNADVAIFETKGLFAMPSGRTPQLRGIQPDVKVEFRKALTAREEDLYMNPLNPDLPGIFPEMQTRKQALEKCISAKNQIFGAAPSPSSEFDPQLGQATDVVTCDAIAEAM